MKHRKFLLMLVLPLVLMTLSYNEVIAAGTSKGSLKIIKTLNVDTTGDGKKETLQILADEENRGYVAKVIHKNRKVYELKPSEEFDFLAPYTPFWKLNTLVTDINGDFIPEIITWGSMTHENPLHIFRWDGTRYKIIFSCFCTGFSFKDITGDEVLELVILNRLYGTGFENSYYQWQNNSYQKIYYEIDAGSSFSSVNHFLGLMPVTQQKIYSKEALMNIFTEQWLSDENNIKSLVAFSKGLLSIQISKYIDRTVAYTEGIPTKESWKLKVKTYRINPVGVVVKELSMLVDMKIINSAAGSSVWRIDQLRFAE